MPEIYTKRVSELLRLVFDLLWFEPKGLPAHEIIRHVSKTIELTEFERGHYSFAPRFQRYEVILRLATVPFVKAGWLVKTDKGQWYITEKGRQVAKQYVDAEEFFEEAVREYGEWKAQGGKLLSSIISPLWYEAKENAWLQIKQYIQAITSSEFTHLFGELLQAIGYHVIWIASQDNSDSDIDIIASPDPIGIKPPRILVRVNHNGQVTTMEGLIGFLSIMETTDVGILVSSGGFTNKLKESCIHDHQNIRLIDLDDFVELWVKNYMKLSFEAQQRIPLRPVYFLSKTD